MLQQFSWTQFLIAFAALSILWYLTLLFTVFRAEMLSFLKLSNGVNIGSEKNEKSISVDQTPENLEEELMGKSKLPEGLEISSISSLRFAGRVEDAISVEDQKYNQLGLIADVVQELKEIFQVLETEKGNKKDFLSLAAMIGEKYGPIGSNPSISSVNQFIRDHAAFAISQEELDNLWD